MENGYLFIGTNIFPTLLAISETEQQHGLMGQEWPPPVMSFIYTEPRINKFWMHKDVHYICHRHVAVMVQLLRDKTFCYRVRKLMATIFQNWQDTVKLASETSKSGDAGVAPAGCHH